MKKIGFDVDGVLADFQSRYIELHIRLSGKNLFPREVVADPANNVPTWYYPQHFGYTDAEDKAVWAALKADPMFWQTIDPLAGIRGILPSLNPLSHDFYFITDRSGLNVKRQTEHWLVKSGYSSWPTVLISSEKAMVARALKLDAYIDDKLENANAVAETNTASYLIMRGWNQTGLLDERVKRVSTVTEFLIAAGV